MMLWSKEHRFIFVKTKKTAGTTIEVLLQDFCVDKSELQHSAHSTREIITPSGIVGFRGKWRPPWCRFYNHMPLQAIYNRLGKDQFERCLVVASVRDPYDAAVSFFHQKYLSVEQALEVHQRNPDRLKQLFLKSVKKNSNQNIYFDVQGSNRVDAVIRFEELVTDLRDLADRLDLSSLKNRIDAGEMPSLKQRSRKSSRLKISDYFTEASLRIVNGKYQRWFVGGNYPKASSMDELIR
ncbi:MAG: hypothetical protein CBB81_10320 [Cellvibrionales bacterium TMED21]|nr:MAG: hypothetical protein CBB81_10320 [Cellvibrionales bacterium TMED21]|tara:strand:- start:6033 stop:6746 length:714 start_codon:yes stop_codon:yes gene_type:complete